MAKQIMSYETVMVFSMAKGEENVAALADRFKSLIEGNGTINNVEDWGKRRLAYPINDELEGHYFLVDFTSVPSFPAELDRVYKITDGVLRTLIVCKEEQKQRFKAKANAEAEATPVAEVQAEAVPTQQEEK